MNCIIKIPSLSLATLTSEGITPLQSRNEATGQLGATNEENHTPNTKVTLYADTANRFFVSLTTSLILPSVSRSTY